MPILGIIASQGRVPSTSYESIATVSVGSGGASDITFSSIPSTFTHLQIRFNLFNAGSGASFIQVNGDTGNNYSYHYLGRAGASTVVAGGDPNQPRIFMGNTSQVNNRNLSHIIDILDYKNTNKAKSIKILSGIQAQPTGTADWIGLSSGAWYNTSAITSIRLFQTGGTFTQYTKASLYGIKGA
jgi:hypothetical protein